MLKPKSQNRYYVFFLVSIWILINGLLFAHSGIETGFESLKYIKEAENLITTGHYSSVNFLFYSTEIFLIAFSLKIGLGYGFVVFVQLIVNGLSLICLHRMFYAVSISRARAFVYTSLLLLMVYYQAYNFYLFTESLYFSFSIIYAYCIFRLDRINIGKIVLITAGLLILLLTRPVGALFIPATAIYIIHRFYAQTGIRIKWIYSISVFIIFFLVMNFAAGSGGEFDFLKPYVEEHIICGVPTANNPEILKEIETTNSLGGLWYIITHYPVLTFKLAFQRVLKFFSAYRSYYSFWHNLILCGYFYIIYVLMALTFKTKWKSHKPHMLFALTILLFTVFTVAITCDDWHNRFLISVLPFLLFLALPVSNKPDGLPD